MRLLSYNILDGGAERFAELFGVIRGARPEIVALVEADDPNVVEKLAAELGMEFVFGEGRKHGVAVLCRWRIVESVNHALLRAEFEDCCLEATTVDDAGNRWTLAALHLHARAREADEEIRLREIGALLEIFATPRREGRPHLLCGDFNANAPGQVIDPQKCKKRTREDWEANGGKLPRRAVAQLLEAGYVDSLQAVYGDAAFRMGSFTTEFPGQRVDYIFSFGPQRLREAGIVTDASASVASDHFAVTLEVGPGRD